jgi:predicted GNAT family acetyltransferase
VSAVKHVDGAFIVEGADGKRLAETTYTRDGDVMTMPHTWVDDSLRGQGIAKQLVDAAVAYAREHHYTIVPVCPFVKAAFDKDPSIADVRKH